MSWSNEQPVRILTVCTMNICRSPALEQALSVALAERGLGELVAVSSAGTRARAGSPRCPVTVASRPALASAGARSVDELLAGSLSPDGASPLERLQDADLILAADRDHVSHLVRLDPSLRTRILPALTAARLATWIVDSGGLAVAHAKATGQPLAVELDSFLAMTNPLPASPAERLRWLVTEMDAARGIAPSPVGSEDIPDPHVEGDHLHPQVAAAITKAASDLIQAFEVVVTPVT